MLFLLYPTKQRNQKWKNLKDLTFVIEVNGRWLIVDRWIKRENHDDVSAVWNKNTKQGEGIERERNNTKILMVLKEEEEEERMVNEMNE